MGQKNQHASRWVSVGCGLSLKGNTGRHKNAKGNKERYTQTGINTRRERDTGKRQEKRIYVLTTELKHRGAEQDKGRPCETKGDKESHSKSEGEKDK